MKFLLFFVSGIFSLIFYIFHSLSKGRDIFGKKISNLYELDSFSGNLLIESFIFLVIGIIFLYIFSDLKGKGSDKFKNYKIEIAYFLFYIFLFFQIYFFNKQIDIQITFIIILFIISDILFSHIFKIKYLFKKKEILRYSGLIGNYIVSYFSMFYIYKNGLSIIPFGVLIFSICFNFIVHKKYINYISLFNMIIFILFLLYSLYFLVSDYIDIAKEFIMNNF